MSHLRVTGRAADIFGAAFYGGVALVALAGQTTAAVAWLHWPVEFALPAVALLELGGIALAARSDFRRRLGEQAIAARALSAGVAVFAVVFQVAGHTNHLQGGFFAGMSALGYLLWLIQAGERRRDHLRAAGKLPPTPPVYGWWRWLRRPAQTAQARALALAEGLDLYQSLAAVARARQAEQEQARLRRRQAAIAEVLRRKVSASADKLTADIATTVYDLDEIARRLAASADYDGLTALIGADLAPGRLLAAVELPQGRNEPAEVPLSAHVPAVVVSGVRRNLAGTTAAQVVNVEEQMTRLYEARQAAERSAPAKPRTSGRGKPAGGRGKRAAGPPRRSAEQTRQAAAELRAKDPTITRAEVARLLGISATRLRQVEQPVNGTEPATR
jgi:hypothetical protein